jgi:hypothetical protein
MKKSLIIDNILIKVDKINLIIHRTYGVSHGVGYDMTAYVTFDNGVELDFAAHAVPKSWDSLGHIRPNNPYYKYSGSNDVYKERVIDHWEKKNGFKYYLERFKKQELEYLLQVIQIGDKHGVI